MDRCRNPASNPELANSFDIATRLGLIWREMFFSTVLRGRVLLPEAILASPELS